MAMARKIFRLFKYFNEYINIRKYLNGDMSPVDKYLSVLTRLMFMFYWFFDNLAILIKIKFIRTTIIEIKTAVRLAYRFWLLGLILGIIHSIKNLVILGTEEVNLIKKKSEMDSSKYKEAMTKLKINQTNNTINLIKNIGDSMVSSQGLDYPKQYLGFEFNDGLCGIGGFVSAALTCYQTYPSK